MSNTEIPAAQNPANLRAAIAMWETSLKNSRTAGAQLLCKRTIADLKVRLAAAIAPSANDIACREHAKLVAARA